MNSELIPLEYTGQFPRLITDYLSMKDDIQDYIEYSPSMDGLIKRIQYLEDNPKGSSVLTSVIEEQHGRNLTEHQRSNLAALKTNEAFTVCTGHQLCLFGGPVYMIYKIASVISLSKRLTEETGRSIIPLFWMASEDHDVEEVSSISLFGRRIGLESKYEGPVGNMPLDGLEITLKELDDILGESPSAESASQLIRDAYSDAPHMAAAFRALIQRLFGKYGLLILDASDQRLKASFVEPVVNEVLDRLTYNSISTTLKMLESRGESVQASPREVNLFYMLDDSRKRIVKKGDAIEVLEGPTWSVEEFKHELNEHPERFSPNVLFRPIYQEYLLPNVAYIGGPGELSYWLELKESFKAFGLKMPVLLLRDSFIWLDERTEKRWNDLGFKAIDLFRDEDSLYKEFAKNNSEEEPDLSDDKETMLKHFDGLIQKSHAIDPGILGFAKSERARLLKSIDNLEKKLLRAEKKKHSDSLNRISTIRSKFLPGGSLRERNENFLHWYLRYGEEFIDMLLEMSDPLEAKVKVVKI